MRWPIRVRRWTFAPGWAAGRALHFRCFLNDKYAWRKIFDRNPAFTELSDKLKAKDHALRTCADVQVAKTLWTGHDAADIPDDILKGNVVVKTNNASGRNVHVVAGRHERGDLNRQANDWLRHPMAGGMPSGPMTGWSQTVCRGAAV